MNGSDPSVPWLVAAYVVTGVLIGAYLFRLWTARRSNAKRQKDLGDGPK